ncbi:TagK domain-containing protein [Cupriavidus taiwanensis]|uniref:TagK domain-containing protein n=1 Tax=Cupriavidus taiwanensis TaxID=164546 RepID=UPI0020C6BA1D|nr:TagK domain-containing protein [Cupriavidus taiwanensis]
MILNGITPGFPIIIGRFPQPITSRGWAMINWQNRTAEIAAVDTRPGGDSAPPWPSDAPGATQPATADPYALVKPAGACADTDAAAADPADVLDQLKREAEAALRDPDYVSAHAGFAAPTAGPVPVLAEGDAKPLQTPAREANHGDSLLDMLATAGHIDSLLGARATLEDHELFSMPAVPDVLWLFAGDMAPARRRGVTARLTRREHHLVSMDSAYRPAPASAPGRDGIRLCRETGWADATDVAIPDAGTLSADAQHG